MAASLGLLVLLVTLRTGREFNKVKRTLTSTVSGVVAVNLQYQRMKNAIPEVISKNMKY